MKIFSAVVLALAVSLIPLSSEGQQRPGLPAQEVSKINDLSATFAKAVLSKDWKTAAGFYAHDAILYPPGESAVKGRAAIEACLAGLPAMTDFKLRNTKVDGRDDLAYVQGTYTMTVAPRGGSEPAQESGYYVEIRRKQPDGRWLIAVHMLSAHE